MNNIDYNQSGGFPLSTQILAAAQEAYRGFNAYGNLAGELAIISGCETINVDEVADGFVSIYGELLPFKSATKSDHVVIVEVPDLRGFEDGSAKAVIYTRYATFGSSAVQYPWANFRRPKTLFQLEDEMILLKKAVPIGLVAVWGLPADQIPEGWVEHTALSGKVPVGHLDGDLNFGALDQPVGTAQVTIGKINLPNYDIPITVKDPYDGSNSNGGFDGSNDNIWKNRTFNINTGGGGQSMTNIQP